MEWTELLVVLDVWIGVVCDEEDSNLCVVSHHCKKVEAMRFLEIIVSKEEKKWNYQLNGVVCHHPHSSC